MTGLAVWLAVTYPAAATFLVVSASVLAPFIAADLVIRGLFKLEERRWLNAWGSTYFVMRPAHDHWACRSALQCRRGDVNHVQ